MFQEKDWELLYSDLEFWVLLLLSIFKNIFVCYIREVLILNLFY